MASKSSSKSRAILMPVEAASAYTSALSESGLTIKLRRQLDFKLFSGASFTIVEGSEANSTAVLERISSASGVKKAWPLSQVSTPADRLESWGGPSKEGNQRLQSSSNSTGFEPHLSTQIDLLHKAGYTGKGVKIGIIDDGVDYTHPDLGGCFGEGCLVAYGANLVIDIPEMINGEIPGPDDPIDRCATIRGDKLGGHGTHVAGTIAAQRNEVGFVGAAPDATIGMYRALDCLGYGEDDAVLAAMNMAFEDGSDIISMSLGGGSGWPESPIALAAERIVQAGVPIVAAAGNYGQEYLFQSSEPAAGRGVVSAGSTDVRKTPKFEYSSTYQVDDQEEESRFRWEPLPIPLSNISLPLVSLDKLFEDRPINGSLGCRRLPKGHPEVSGQVLLVKAVYESDGDEYFCDEYEQLWNLVDDGAEHLIFYKEDVEDLWSPFAGGDYLGAGVVGNKQAQTWLDLIDAGSDITVNVKPFSDIIPDIVYTENTVSGGFASFFTSWGPGMDMGLSPSFAAPGGSSMSTLPVDRGMYGVYSGTSMSTPLIAGAMALVGQARGTFDPTTLHAVFASSSRQLVFHDVGKPQAGGGLAPVAQLGSGLVQAWDAAQVSGVLSTNGIALNDTDNLDEVVFTLKNTGTKAATYELGHTSALTVYGFQENLPWYLSPPPLPVDESAVAELSFETSSVKVGAGETVELRVNCTLPAGVDPARLPLYSGWITLTGTNGDELTLPYLGIAASMKDDIDILPGFTEVDPSTEDYPNHGRVRGVVLRQHDDWKFPAADGEHFVFPIDWDSIPYEEVSNFPLPVVGWDLVMPSRFLKAQAVAVDKETGTKVLEVYDWLLTPYAHTEHVLWGWAGALSDGWLVPAGRYKFRVSAVKPFGDPEKPEDWEVRGTLSFFLDWLE